MFRLTRHTKDAALRVLRRVGGAAKNAHVLRATIELGWLNLFFVNAISMRSVIVDPLVYDIAIFYAAVGNAYGTAIRQYDRGDYRRLRCARADWVQVKEDLREATTPQKWTGVKKNDTNV